MVSSINAAIFNMSNNNWRTLLERQTERELGGIVAVADILLSDCWHGCYYGSDYWNGAQSAFTVVVLAVENAHFAADIVLHLPNTGKIISTPT